MSIPYIDATTLEAEIAHYLPSVTFVVGFIPGTFGNTLVAVLKFLTNPKIVGPVVELINTLSGATFPPPGMLRAPTAAHPAPHIWDDAA